MCSKGVVEIQSTSSSGGGGQQSYISDITNQQTGSISPEYWSCLASLKAADTSVPPLPLRVKTISSPGWKYSTETTCAVYCMTTVLRSAISPSLDSLFSSPKQPPTSLSDMLPDTSSITIQSPMPSFLRRGMKTSSLT